MKQTQTEKAKIQAIRRKHAAWALRQSKIAQEEIKEAKKKDGLMHPNKGLKRRDVAERVYWKAKEKE